MLQEVYGKIAKKPYLSRRIAPKLAEHLAANLLLIAEVAEDTPDVVGTPTRDQKDDYLIAHAVFAHVDYIVSGDRDLLELQHRHPFRIVSPSEFVRILEQEQQSS